MRVALAPFAQHVSDKGSEVAAMSSMDQNQARKPQGPFKIHKISKFQGRLTLNILSLFELPSICMTHIGSQHPFT